MASNSARTDKKTHILLGVTGSVAAIKTKEIITTLQSSIPNCEIRFIPTQRALHFFNPEDPEIPAEIFLDEEEWSSWRSRGDPVLHIELRKWADVFVIAPLDANSMGKIANGLCDNLLTCVARAWDFKQPILFAPAMNTLMWEHPVTTEQITRLKSWGFEEIPCVEKLLMCGDKGLGAMASVETIVKYTADAVKRGMKRACDELT